MINKGGKMKFSQKEIKVLTLMKKGYQNKKIATDMRLSENTVKSHIQHIFLKFNAHNRTEAVMMAIQKGIINDQG